MSRGRKHHSRRHSRRHHRGGNRLVGAPLDYHLSGDWSSRMSLGQGEDFFKYHEGQHGGRRRRHTRRHGRRHRGGAAPFPSSVVGTPLISADMVGPAMQTGPLRAYADVRGLTDAPDSVQQAQTGGRRRRHRSHRSHRRKTGKHCGGRHRGSRTCKHCRRCKKCECKGGKRKHSRRHSRRRHSRRHRGGALTGAPLSAPDMLLPSREAYDQAGLNPGYRGAATEYAIAAQRDALDQSRTLF